MSPIQSKVMDSMSWVILELPSTKSKAEFKILVQHQIMEGRSKKCHELNQLEVTIGIAQLPAPLSGSPRIIKKKYFFKAQSG